MTRSYDPDDEDYGYHKAAAVVASMLTIEDDDELTDQLRDVLELTPWLTAVVLAALAGMVRDFLDDLWEPDDPERLEWIAQRVDVIARTATR